jgi:hypothetical protein
MKFEVGEVAIHVSGITTSLYDGAECVVVMPIGTYLCQHPETLKIRSVQDIYVVRFADGLEKGAHPNQLRKKRPPEELGSWDEVERMTKWRPAGVNA